MFVGAPLAVLALRQPRGQALPTASLSLDEEARQQVARATAHCDLENLLDPARKYQTGPTLFWRLRRAFV